MTAPRPTTKFRLAAAALVGASRAEPRFPQEIRDRPVAAWVCAAPSDPGASDDELESRLRAAAAVRSALEREAVFRVADRLEEADVVLAVTRASSQPSLDFWETRHAHARLTVRRTGQVLDAGSNYVEGRTWDHVGSTVVYLAKLQCAEHCQAIVRSRALPVDAAAPPPESASTRESCARPLQVDESALSDDRIRSLLARLRAKRRREPG